MGSVQSHTPSWLLLVGVLCLPDAAAGIEQTTHEDKSVLVIDLAADEQYRRCLAHLSANRHLQARSCLKAIVQASPQSTAALRAKSALQTLNVQRIRAESTIAPPGMWPFKPGRLELSLMAGGMGIFTGGAFAGSLSAQSFASRPPLLPLISGVGGTMAVALGSGFAVGSFLLGEVFDLKPGKSRLIGSGIGWGVGLGLAMSPWIFMLSGTQWPQGSVIPELATINYGLAIPAASLVSVTLAYAGLALGAGTAYFLDLTPGQVSLVNTGAWSGLALGALASPLMGLAGFGHAGWLGLAWVTGAALGLGWGAAMALMLELDVWEVLCIDIAGLAALAGAGLTTGALALVAGNLLWLNALLAGLTGAALIAALAAATAGMAFWRIQRGGKVSRLGMLPLHELFTAPEAEVVFDKAGQATPIAGLFKLTF